MDPNVDNFFSEADNWQKEMEQLRAVCLESGLHEVLKWRLPCYTYEESNIAIIQPFNESCALMFFKGILMKDPEDIMEKPGENSRIARRVRFTSVDEIEKLESILKEYIQEAIEIEKADLKVPEKETKELEYPDELQEKFDENPALKTAFEELTPGRQRGYILHFSRAKQSKTRERRIEKYIPKILDGKGIHDR